MVPDCSCDQSLAFQPADDDAQPVTERCLKRTATRARFPRCEIGNRGEVRVGATVQAGISEGMSKPPCGAEKITGRSPAIYFT
jgi:hypothetical protein